MSGYVKVNGTRVFYLSQGDGPAVLFLHAGVADHRMWRHQVGAFPGMQTVAFDRRGFGRSQWEAAAFSDLDDSLAVIDHLALSNPVVVGCSVGGSLALRLARARPELVRGLVLVGADAPGFEPERYQSPHWPPAVKAFEAGDLERVAQLDAEMWVVGVGRTRDDVDDDVFHLVQEMDLIPLETETEREKHQNDQRLDSLSDLQMPVLVIVGQHDMPDLVESAHHLAARLSDSPVAIIEGSAHLPSMERPEQFNRHLSDFFATL